MAINKVVYGNTTLVDLTEDTATEEDVMEGKTFHDASGQKRTGSATQGGRVQDVEVNGESVVDAEGIAEVVVPVIDDEDISNESVYSSEKIEDRLDEYVDKDAVEEKSATDEFTTINGGLLSECKVALSPNQDLSHGDPSPTNICPISGHTQVEAIRTGKNLVKFPQMTETSSGVTFTLNADGSAQIVGAASGGNAYFNIYNWSTFADTVLFAFRGKTLRLAGGNNNIRYTIAYRKNSSSTPTEIHDTGNHPTITFPTDPTYQIYVALRVTNGVTVNETIIPMLLMPDETDTTPELYQGQTVTVNLGGTYYSGTLDVVSGVFVPDTAERDLSTLTFRSVSQNRWLSEDIKAEVKHPSDSSIKIKFWSDSYNYTDAVTLYFNSFIGIAVDNEGNLLCRNKDTNPPIGHIVYELATSLTIQLTPQQVKALVGENHLSAPLEGQEIVESKYKEAFDFNDVMKVANYFTLPLQTFTFTNKICNVNDSRVTSNSLVDVYFTSASISSVEDAGITVESQSGKIVMTAEEQPVGTIQGRIKVVN